MLNNEITSPPTLTTDRLTLRPLSIDDQQAILALRSNTEINKYLNRKPAETKEDAIDFINSIEENCKKGHSLYWAIDLTEATTFLGTICLFDFSSDTNSCEIGFELMPEFQGKGIMKEAAGRVIEYAIEALHIQTVLAFTHKDNQSSIQLLEKLCFRINEIGKTGNVDLISFVYWNSKKDSQYF